MNLSRIELPSNRNFGLFFTVIFLAIGVYFLSETSNKIAYGFLILAALLLAITIYKADLLLPLNKMWIRFGLLLGMMFNPIVLGIIFFGVFSPISLFMKLFGRDELRLKFKQKTSHWISRDPSTELLPSCLFRGLSGGHKDL